jgi:hypothetical protein
MSAIGSIHSEITDMVSGERTLAKECPITPAVDGLEDPLPSL